MRMSDRIERIIEVHMEALEEKMKDFKKDMEIRRRESEKVMEDIRKSFDEIDKSLGIISKTLKWVYGFVVVVWIILWAIFVFAMEVTLSRSEERRVGNVCGAL